MNDNVALFSFIGMLVCGGCGVIGASIVGRATYRALLAIWERRADIDEEVERDFQMRVR